MIRTRRHGKTDAPASIVVLHGGPGAPGSASTLAQELAETHAVLEPLQRRADGKTPLTVARHVDDLEQVLAHHGTRPVVVGHSWGAMLALAHEAAHPSSVRGIVLVGCGTFDSEARRQMNATRHGRLDAETRRRVHALEAEMPDPDARMAAMGELFVGLDSVDLVSTALGTETCDARGHHESWQDMMRLEREGAHPSAFARIAAPVLMLHGEDDPHPGPAIRDGLRPHLPALEYRELSRCGHYPWLERDAHEEFLAILRSWIERHLSTS